MGIYDFTDDARLAQRTHDLALELAAAQASALQRGWALGLERPSSSWLGQDRRSDVPEFLSLLQVYGVGLFSEDAGERAVALVDPALFGDGPPSIPVAATEVRGARRALARLGGFESLQDIHALAVPPPQPQFCPGIGLNASGLLGTFGAQVVTASGSTAILTAGHVAGAHMTVTDPFGHSGVVLFSVDPAQVPRAIVTADVAVVLPQEAASPPAIMPLDALAKAPAAASLTLTGAMSGPQHAQVMGVTPYLYVPRMAGMWGELYFTTVGCTTGGDSGGPATLAGTSQLVGHVVGGSGAVTSFIQEAEFQLNAANVAFDPSP